MKDSNQTALPTLADAPNHFSAVVCGKPFVTTALSGLLCLRPELMGVRNRSIWKIHAAGHVARRRTILGLFIDQTLEPGTYDLVRNDRLTAVYHLTPPKVAQVYHSRDFQHGSVTLLECNVETGRLRGTFEFAMSAINFKVCEGEFDLLCPPQESTRASIG